MLALRVVLCILSSIIFSDCSDCRFILNNPDGVNNFNIVLDCPIPIGGIITMEGVLNTEHAPTSGVPDKEFLRFIAEDDPEDAPILEIETQVHDSQQCMFMSGTLRDENTSRFVSYPNLSAPRKQICWFDKDGHMKISQDNLVKIQLSSNSSKEEEGYDLHLSGSDKLHSAHSLFQYGSPEAWNKFEHRRIAHTRRIINICSHDCHISFTRITVCSDPLPKLDQTIVFVDIIKAELGKTYTLSCSASGAPYLTAEWQDNEGSIVPAETEVPTHDGSEFSILSQLVIADFDAKDAGNYSCKIFNKNFDSNVEKIFSLHYLSVDTRPELTYSLEDRDSMKLNWTVRGFPLNVVQLDCRSELGELVHFDRYFLSSPRRLRLTGEFFQNNASWILSCVLLRGTGLLDHMVIRRVDSEKSSENADFLEHPTELHATEKSCNCLIWIVFFVVTILFLCLENFYLFKDQIKTVLECASNKMFNKTHQRIANLNDISSPADFEAVSGEMEDKSTQTYDETEPKFSSAPSSFPEADIRRRRRQTVELVEEN